MGLFWTYFTQTLRWPLLLVGGPLAVLVKGAAGSLDQARQDTLWLREQFNPETCDEQFVEDHGRGRGVRRHPLEDFERFRSRVVNAYAWSLLGGKQAGLPKILDHYGFIRASIESLRDEDPERWAEFRCHLESEVRVDEPGYDLFLWVLNDQKRASARLAELKISAVARGPVLVAASAMTGEEITVYPWTAGEIEMSSSLRTVAATHLVETLTVYPE